MVVYEEIEYWLIIPKVIEIILYWILAAKFIRSKKYLLNKLFGAAFIVWSIYTFTDLIMWWNGANSIEWLKIVNVLRDIQMFAAIFYAYLIYICTEIIVKGEKSLNKVTLTILFGINVLIATLLAYNDKLEVYDLIGNHLPPQLWDLADTVRLLPNITTLTGILIAFPLLVYSYCLFLLIRLVQTKIQDPFLKRRMFFLIVGIILIPFGLIWFSAIFAFNIYNIVTACIGRFAWMCSPVFVWRSQSKKEIEKSQSNIHNSGFVEPPIL